MTNERKASRPSRAGYAPTGGQAINTLRGEAAQAGDTAQVELCDRALAGDAEALRECEDVIADARAQHDAIARALRHG